MPSVVKEVFKIVSMYTFNLPNNKELENFRDKATNHDDIIQKLKDEHKAMLDGTRASCVFASLFAIMAFTLTLRNSKSCAIFTTFLIAFRKS